MAPAGSGQPFPFHFFDFGSKSVPGKDKDCTWHRSGVHDRRQRWTTRLERTERLLGRGTNPTQAVRSVTRLVPSTKQRRRSRNCLSTEAPLTHYCTNAFSEPKDATVFVFCRRSCPNDKTWITNIVSCKLPPFGLKNPCKKRETCHVRRLEMPRRSHWQGRPT